MITSAEISKMIADVGMDEREFPILDTLRNCEAGNHPGTGFTFPFGEDVVLLVCLVCQHEFFRAPAHFFMWNNEVH